MARQLAGALQSGRTLIAVPSDMVAEVQAWVYMRRVERVSDKWAKRVAEIPLWTWQAATHERGEQLWGSDQVDSGKDEPTGGP